MGSTEMQNPCRRPVHARMGSCKRRAVRRRTPAPRMSRVRLNRCCDLPPC
jgi:hypothetical protein